jgi:AraC-like DNA-binding protein
MEYRRYTPPPPLSAFVGCIWYSEGLQGKHERERLLPNGESCIVIDLREDWRQGLLEDLHREALRIPLRVCDRQGVDAQDVNRQDIGGLGIDKFEPYAPAIFCGARTDCFVIDTSQQERVIGIQFRAGGAFPFLGMPACEVANAAYSLDDVWPGYAVSLRDELMNAGSVDVMFAILEWMLISRLAKTATLHPAVAFAVGVLARPAQNLRIGDVADRVGFSSRRFIELFRDQTGLTPKAFQRVRRFQHVLQSLRRRSDGNWAALATGCGYYDQAHFIHDFKTFSGMTPGEYVTVATPHLNHLPLK